MPTTPIDLAILVLGVASGPVVGSFLGVLVDRLPAGRPILLARSSCDGCGMTLGLAELIPLVSFAIQGGRCRACAALIRRFHPAIELAATAVPISAALVLVNEAEASTGLFLASLGLGWTLLALAWIDARHLLLPDRLTLPLAGAGLLATAVAMPEAWPDSALGAALGYLAFAGLALAYRGWRGREGLGGGDAKLLAAAGAWVTWAGLPSVVLLAATMGLAVVAGMRLSGRTIGRDTEIPFGPFLAAAIWLVWLLGPIGLGASGTSP